MKSKTFKGFSKLIFYMILGAFTGLFAQRWLSTSGEQLKESLYKFQNIIVNNAYAIYYLILIISILFTLTFYYLGKNEISKSLENEEEEIENNIFAIFRGVTDILGSFLIASMGAVLLKTIKSTEFNPYSIVLVFISFILYTIFYSIFQKKFIENLKELYPEKKGDIYSIKFQKDWEESLDEREKVALYYSGYKTYRALSITMLILLVASIIISDMYNNIYPSIVIAIIMSISTIINLYYSTKSKNIF